MPAVAIRSTALTSTTIKWVKPEPLWASPDSEMTKPFVAEFDKDSFVPDFLAMMGGSTPVDLKKPQDIVPKKPEDANKPDVLKLYQPLHQRYYLLTGSLVCRQFGLPDRTVVRKNGEKTSFVLRRKVNGEEQGWVNDGSNKGWQRLVSEMNRPVLIRKDEQRLPLHPVKTCASTQLSGTLNVAGRASCEQRKVYYGYIPVDGREKYLDRAKNVVQDIQDALDNATLPTGDPRLDVFNTQVIETWRGLYINPVTGNPPSPTPGVDLQQQISLYLIVDLGDFLKNNLLSVFDAVTKGTSLPDNTKRQALFNELGQIFLETNTTTNGQVTLADAIKDLQDSSKLAQAEADPPTATYNVYNAFREYAVADLPAGKFIDPYNSDHQDAPTTPPPTDKIYRVHVRATHQNGAETKVYYLADDGSFHKLVQDALDEEKTERKNNNQPWLTVPEEVADMIKNDPADGDVYYLRLVYEYGDGCVVLSNLSQPFTFARPFDPDAPARHVRIELPSIKLKDLHKFKKGVGMQTSCELNQLTNMLSLDSLSKGNISPPSCDGIGIGMICSFSIQIIMIVAFIVMFTFLIALNFVFWWLAFIKICFPVPKSK